MNEKELLGIIERAAKEGRGELDLSGEGIKSLPAEIGKLTKLERLELYNNQLTSLPEELGRLTKLTVLDISRNQLTSLPEVLGRLTNLTRLYLYNNQLGSLPADIGKLRNIESLFLDNNRFASFPEVIQSLRKIKRFSIDSRHLGAFIESIRNFPNLEVLFLDNQQLTQIPSEVVKLTMLRKLYLFSNQLKSIPKELGRLTNLTELNISYNQLTSLPETLGNLTELEELSLGDNPLESPPAEVVEQGTEAILAYLREQLKESRRQWVSKLLLVGEGGVGKTSLLRALQGDEFVEGLETTHGIAVEKLEIRHPSEANVTMELNTWDFGGQQIYHATHQFFLTNRALFVLVWDARHGWEAGKLYSWLDRIQARAPESPVLIVAAHIDERDADLPLEGLCRKYPRIAGHYKVSNKKREGIEELRKKLAQVAADLPLMGEQWPASWLDAANAIRDRKEHHITPKELYELMAEHEVARESANVLAQWLHELGDILYFREDEELNDLVILNPQWVTEAISRVLESKDVIKKDGIFTRQHMDELWGKTANENIRQHLLRLMERFDLSHRTLEDREISLVVERLPLDPPDYEEKWDGIKRKEGCKEISMKFELSSVPAGIPTWFIARSHRFTTHTHWRMGALFTDSKEERHLGLVEAYPYDKYLRLTVRGPVPQNFFVLLRDGLELTLARFPGLKIQRTMPCPGHDDERCAHEFDFADLQGAITIKDPVLEIQCPKSYKLVSVPGLLFGLHWSTQGAVITRIDDLENKVVGGQEAILTELQELRKLTQREFLRLFNAQQRLAESHCPNVFAVLPKDKKEWLKNIFGQKMVLRLYCQAPGEWHPTVEGGRYEIKQPAEWLKTMGPYIVKLAKVIKYAAPLAGPAAGIVSAAFQKGFEHQIKLMEELAKKLGDGRDFREAELPGGAGEGGKAERVEAAPLRALRKLLDEVDPKQHWGGLKKILTPEGHYLWLCEEHAAEYAG